MPAAAVPVPCTPKPCHDCGVPPGHVHWQGCDVARCLVTGLQQLMCDTDHDCGDDTWTGAPPGTAECAEYGWLLLGPGMPELPNSYTLIMESLKDPPVVSWDVAGRRWRHADAPLDDIFYLHWHAERGLALPPGRYFIDGRRITSTEYRPFYEAVAAAARAGRQPSRPPAGPAPEP